jgi:hypothetical protein
MARHLSVATVIEKNKVSSNVAFVILLDIKVVDPNTRAVVETMRIARNTEAVLFGKDAQGNPISYQPGNFNVNIDQKQTEASTVTITAQDQTGFIQSRMEAMAGGVFSEVVMTVVNTARLDKPPEWQETFQIVDSNVKDFVVTFRLGAENMLNIRFPKHTQYKDRCAWRFKGYGCGYTGGQPTCDYSKDGPNGCKTKFSGNLPFRGVPGLVAMNL